MPNEPIDAVNALLRRQAGAVHQCQVRAAGVSRRQIAGRLASGTWLEPHPRVYVAAGAPESFERHCSAAFLAVRHAARHGDLRRVAVAGWAAAYAHGLLVDEPPDVWLLVPVADSAPRLDGVRVVRARTWPRRVFTAAGGVVVTGVADTIVDIAWYLAPDRLHEVVQDAAFSRKRLPQAILGACRRGRTGSAAARRAAALILAGVDSSLHRRGHAVLAAAGLPTPECGLVLAREAGPSDCVVRASATQRPYGLVVEWDGDAHRVDRRTFLHDREKDRLVRRAGFVTVRYTDAQVRERDGVVADLRAVWTALTSRSVEPSARSRAS